MISRPRIHNTPDRPKIIFNQPRSAVDLDKVLKFQIKFELGTFFDVLFTDHAGKRVLSYAPFLVTYADETMVLTERPDGSTHSSLTNSREWVQLAPWQDYTEDVSSSEKPCGLYVSGAAYRTWNKVSRKHEVKLCDTDELVCEVKDQETADRIAAGELPIAA